MELSSFQRSKKIDPKGRHYSFSIVRLSNFDKDLIKALNDISSKLPFNLLANLAYEVKKSK